MLNQISTITILPCTVEDAWYYLVLSNELDYWKREEDILGSCSLVDGNKFIGFTTPPYEEGLAAPEVYLSHKRDFEYVSLVSEAKQEQVPYDLALFPFRKMYMSQSFSEHPEGSEVLTRVRMDPRGLRGLVLCIFVLRQIRRQMIEEFKTLEAHIISKSSTVE